MTVDENFHDAEEEEVLVPDDASVAESDRPTGYTKDADDYL